MKKITTLLILLTLGLHAIEEAVSARVVPKERYAVSEEIVIQVDIKSTAYSMTQSKIGLENGGTLHKKSYTQRKLHSLILSSQHKQRVVQKIMNRYLVKSS